MNPHKYSFIRLPLTLNKGHMFQTIRQLLKRNKSEVPIPCWQVNFYSTLNKAFPLQPIGNKVSYRDNLKTKLLSNSNQLRHTSHSAIFVHYFDKDSGRIQTGKACQVNSSFCVTGSPEYSFLLCPQWEYVSRAAK